MVAAEALLQPPTQAEVLSFLWSGQSGVYEMAHRLDRRKYFIRMDEALGAAPTMRYFAPLTRVRRGSTREDVSQTGNVLWTDIDSLDGRERIRSILHPLDRKASAALALRVVPASGKLSRASEATLGRQASA